MVGAGLWSGVGAVKKTKWWGRGCGVVGEGLWGSVKKKKVVGAGLWGEEEGAGLWSGVGVVKEKMVVVME